MQTPRRVAGRSNSVDLAAPVTDLPRVGPKLAEKLRLLGIVHVRDLLLHLPRRYQDRTRITPIGTLRDGADAVIQGTVDLAQVRYARRRMLLVRVSDGTGALLLRFFYFNAAQQSRFQRGATVRCFGEIRAGPQSLEMIHPEYRFLDPYQPAPVEETLTPIYPATMGLGQHSLRKLILQVLQSLRSDASPSDFIELLPEEALRDEHWPTLMEAIQYLHQPPPDSDLARLQRGEHPAQQRLAVEELTAHQLSLRALRQALRRRRAPAMHGNQALRKTMIENLPYALTGAQQRVLGEIQHDLGSDQPMLRLLQGDVGAGKTVVAALAALNAVECGFQAALMAPTELLAEQHQRNFERWLTPLGVTVLLLTGRLKRAERRRMLDRIRDESPAFIIGTHALFQEEVIYARLGFIIVDEQHRFGVEQRLALAHKAGNNESTEKTAHQLIMTATPIPRTLAMTAYADLDVSVLDELPPQRLPVHTVVIPEHRRAEIVARVHTAIGQGRQIYWVCPLIDESEIIESEAATETASALSQALPEARVGLIHGRLKENDRDAVMRAFAEGNIDLLVATTVIEVGVDVPNASLMVIENAERLGLSQLHQLRGRVGRGAAKSDCVLLYHQPLSADAQARLQCMRETHDGFVVAQRDLELRGPGELLGTRQTGLSQMHIADLFRDHALVPKAQRIATRMLEAHPDRVPLLIQRWLPDALHYGSV